MCCSAVVFKSSKLFGPSPREWAIGIWRVCKKCGTVYQGSQAPQGACKHHLQSPLDFFFVGLFPKFTPSWVRRTPLQCCGVSRSGSSELNYIYIYSHQCFPWMATEGPTHVRLGKKGSNASRSHASEVALMKACQEVQVTITSISYTLPCCWRQVGWVEYLNCDCT